MQLLLRSTLVVGIALANPATTVRAEAQTNDVQFTSPSGNIDCYVSASEAAETSVNCIVQNANWKNAKPRPSDCELDWSPYEISLVVKGRGNAVKPNLYVGGCRGDIGPACFDGPGKTVDRSCAVLAFGKKRTFGPITCESMTNGIRCVTSRGKKLGFLIGRNSWTLVS
jgi:hypothetical protein